MPGGIPVATFAIGEAGATNAALFAIGMLAADDERLRDAWRPTGAAPHRRCVEHPAACVTTRTATDAPVVPPATIGMLGGGQLGRYALMAARTMGYRTVVLEPDPHAPAGAVADEHLVAAYDDPAALDHMAATCAVVTTEFENPSASALERLAASTNVRPSAAAVAVAQDRRLEKGRLSAAGVPVGPFAVIDAADDLYAATVQVSFPAVLKTARMGYDGKGQVTVADADDLHPAWTALGEVACVLEERLHLHREVSVLVARAPDGATVTYPVAENVHVDGILDLSVRTGPRRRRARS